jgi:hypothetical protein
MPVPIELEELKQQIAELQGQLEEISEEEWQAYVKVRDILRVARTIVEAPTVPQAVEADAAVAAAAEGTVPGYYITHPTSHACAMQGIFEPGQEQGTSTEYDAAAVERFAALGG